MTEQKKRHVDAIDTALRRVRKTKLYFADGKNPDAIDEQYLRDTRAACSALLRLTPEQRQKVLAAAEALGQ